MTMEVASSGGKETLDANFMLEEESELAAWKDEKR